MIGPFGADCYFMNKVFLLPGQIYFSDGSELISTVLGSCVSVVFYDSVTKKSVMTHYVLPEFMANRNQAATARYGDIALEQAISWFKTQGVPVGRVQAKVYGGANMSDGNTIGEAIGASNIVFAIQYLTMKNISIVEENLGGFIGRKIIFHSHNFQVEHLFQQAKRAG